jgi:hypothetical protein
MIVSWRASYRGSRFATMTYVTFGDTVFVRPSIAKKIQRSRT